jgi:hypothetical protein
MKFISAVDWLNWWNDIVDLGQLMTLTCQNHDTAVVVLTNYSYKLCGKRDPHLTKRHFHSMCSSINFLVLN